MMAKAMNLAAILMTYQLVQELLMEDVINLAPHVVQHGQEKSGETVRESKRDYFSLGKEVFHMQEHC